MSNVVSLWSLWRPGRLADQQRSSLIATLVDKAADAESQAQGDRADFYWDQACRLERPDLDVLVGFALAHRSAAGEKVSERELELWRRILEATRESSQIERFFPLVEERCWKLVNQGDETGLKQATTLTDRFWKAAPESADVQQLWIEIRHAVAMTRAKLAPEGSRAPVVDGGIKEIVAQESRLGHHIEYFRRIGVLEHQLAIYLANEDKLSGALAAIGRALTYNPDQDGIHESYGQLVEAMKTFQANVYAAVAQVNATPNAILNSKGQLLKAEADRGFSGLEAWNSGEDAQRVARLREISGARTSWIRVGLAPEERWTEKGMALVNALQPIFANPPADSAALAAEVARAKSETTELNDHHWSRIHEWLRHRFFQEPTPLPIPPQTLKATISPGRKEEDFRDWVAAPVDLRIKAQMMAATILFALTATFTTLEASRVKARDADWTRISEAVARHDDAATIAGAESYLQHARPRTEERSREVAVRRHYEEALMRWVATQPQDLTAQATQHLETFQHLMKANRTEGGK